MGSLNGTPRAAMGATVWGIEFLGWNVRWVLGYPGTSELVFALERGEIDMTSTGNASQIRRLLDTGRIKILARFESGGVVRSEFGDAPTFVAMMEGKIGEPAALKGFDYYSAMAATD